ncbi:heterokaryon incompatibility protein-domain-containing protein [Suillus spraguei]|nr:heterokaryon incompatibility protein-domain-containing protein [Suillus spraguei]
MTFVERNEVREHFGTSYIKRLGQPSGTVRYAILSHRWLNQGEPTYEEIKAGTAAGPGYEKLKNFCAKAVEYSMEFAWSDTCCINRSSSTELDESIRSMFRWYGNSAICIVHLAQSETIEDIMEDEWTERGWTLQELLAPARIKFVNKYWVPMTGDRNDKDDKDDINERREPAEILETLERATGIPYDDLRRKFCPSPSEVDKRMTWAARRKTTRVEDVAYSLMGMFDVSLQIAYGEGGDRAFCRGHPGW